MAIVAATEFSGQQLALMQKTVAKDCNTGEFDLSEDQVRGDDFVGQRPTAGGHPSGAASYPYMLADKHPDAVLFEGDHKVRFEKILTLYPNKQAALLPTLALAQEVRGHVSPQTMDRVAELLGLAPAYVRGVTTFYTMYNKAPVGRYLVQVCTNISCWMRGGDELLDSFCEAAGADREAAHVG